MSRTATWCVRVAAVALSAGLLGACGSTFGTGFGDVEVRVTPYGPDGRPSGLQWEGVVELTAQAFLSSGTLQRPVSGAESVSLDLASNTEIQLGLNRMQGGFYDDVEVAFTAVSVRITGPDLEEPRDVTVELGSNGSLRVDNDNSLLVNDGGRTVIIVRLRMDEWIPEDGGTVVPGDLLEDAVTMDFRTE